MTNIPEADWRLLRAMQDEKLNLACGRILDQVQALLDQRDGGEHDTYLALFKLLELEDEALSLMFDDWRRSRAIHSLIQMLHHGVLTEEDVERFTPETRSLLERWRALTD